MVGLVGIAQRHGVVALARRLQLDGAEVARALPRVAHDEGRATIRRTIHGFAVMHGKTRRGALVFDIADIVKDTIILPLAFMCASDNACEQEFRELCLSYFTDYHALDVMFETVKGLALNKEFE